MTELSVVGKNIPRVDALDKVTGRTKYTADFEGPLLHAKILRSPHAHARIISIDTSRAEKFPGVRGVVTPQDAPTARTGYILCRDRYVLPVDGIVRFIGEPVAVVAADSPEIAEEALEQIEVNYEVLPTVFEAEESMEKTCPVIIHPDKFAYGKPGESLLGCVMERELPNGCATLHIRRGDIEKGFREADIIVENRYSYDGGSHARPELFVMDAWVDGDVLTVRCARTRMWGCHGWLCSLFNLPPSKVRLITPFTGGAFGGKGTIVTEALALLAAMKTGRRVRLAFTREEEFIDTNPRPTLVVYVKDGVKKDGTIVARQLRTIVDIGAYGAAGGTISGFTSQQGVISLYKIPNWHCDSYTVYTNNPPTGTMRGVEGPQVSWGVESNMDCIAHELGIDPLELRRKHIVDEGDTTALGQVLHNIYARECLEKAAELIEWDKKAEPEGKWKKGKGLGICSYGAGPWWPSAVQAKVFRDGTIEVRVGTDESGQGLINTMSQIAAEEFKTSVDKISIIRGDTQNVPWDWGSVASRSTWMTGNAVIKACQDAKQKLFRLAASKLQLSPDDLEISGDKVYCKKSPEKAIRFGDLFHYDLATGEGEILGVGVYEAKHTKMEPETGYSPEAFPEYSYMAYGIETAVNTETGEIKILKVASAADIGQPINWKMCEGQIEGSIGMGIGCILYEKFERSKGMILNPNFVSYKMPTAPEIPSGEQVKSASVGLPHPDGPFGAKALGEMGLLPFSPAVGNAVYNATGVRMKDAPLTRERVFFALRQTSEQ
ncbi:xanthine dehydrogenase family protein molybdopterin-binding subunit [Chloroflexota bacterium]